MGNNAESERRQEHEVVSGVQNENGEQSEILVQVQSDMRTVQSESDGLGNVSGGRTDRDLRNEVDEFHGEILPSSGGRNETVSQVSDSSTFSEQERNELQEFAGRTVRTDESTSDRLRRSTEMGTGENVLLGQHGDERNSPDSGDRSIDEKLNAFFTEEPVLTETAETEKVVTNDNFSEDNLTTDDDEIDTNDFSENFDSVSDNATEKVAISGNFDSDSLSDEEQLVKITAEISKKMAEFTELVTNEDFAEAVDVSKELQQLTQHSAELKKKIQQKQITVDDINTLRNIQPSRKSVQNMLDSEISQIPKFEKLLQDEFGDKSAFEMRNSNNSLFEDDSQTVPVIKVQNHNIPNKLTLLRNKEYLPEFNRGTFTNKHSNITIIFGKKSIEETIAKSIQDRRRNIPVDARINALYNAEELIENSVIFDTQLPKYSEKNSNDKSSNTLFMHNLYAVMTYDGQPYLAKLSVKESYSTDLDDVLVNTMNRLYNLKDIKITPIEANRIFSPTVNSDNAAEDTSINATFYISISQLYELVKAYDKNFFENPEAIGREERETEILVHAEYDDAVETLKTGEKTTAKVDKAVENLAKNHNTDIKQAKNIAEQLKKRRSKNGDVIIGNTTFKYIPEKTYTKIDRETAEKVAEQLESQGIKFSGVIKGDTVTITVSKPNKEILDKIIADISESTEKEKVATNGNSDITKNIPEIAEKTPTDFINKIKELVLNDDSIRNAALNSDDDLLHLEIKTKLQNYSTQIIIENTETYSDDYNNFNGNVDEIADKTAEEIFQTAVKASPHLHINFIPFYTQERKNSLSKGVSMRAALNEQGFIANNFKENRLVAWEESERQVMEKILQKYGFERDDKQAKYEHQTVDNYKKSQDEKKIISAMKATRKISKEEIDSENIRRLHERLKLIEKENKTLEKQKNSPYKSFFYSSSEKQSFVQAKLDEKNIPYRETENGFEAQECYVDEIRKIEKEFKPTNLITDKIREDVDRLLMQSANIDEFLEKLRKEKYEIKKGKYLAVKHPDSKRFTRLKSLGENYSEYALRNRIKARKKYEIELENKINTVKKDSPEFIVLRTIKFYTIAFSKGDLPMRKRNHQKPFSWNNDSELDKIIELNNKINSGATLESLHEEFENAEKSVAEKEKMLDKSKSDLKTFYDLKEKIEIIFEGKKSEVFTYQQAEETLKKYPHINSFNYHNVEMLIKSETESVHQAEESLQIEKENLKKCADIFSTAEKVFGGTYVQSIAGMERERKESDFIPNGLKKS